MYVFAKRALKNLLVALSLALLAAPAGAQGLGPATYVQTAQLFTSTGVNLFVVPSNVTIVYIDSVDAGQSGAGGQASATGGGGGGGAGGGWTYGFPCFVTPGSTLTLTVGIGGVAPAAGAAGNNPATRTAVSGCINTFPSLAPNVAVPGTGSAGAGGAGGSVNNAIIVAATGGAATPGAGSNASSFSTTNFASLPITGIGGGGGGGGGDSGAAGSNGGAGGSFGIWVRAQGGTAATTVAGGGAGGGTPFGAGAGGASSPAGTAGVSCSIGYGGGGGGGASNGAGGAACNGMIAVRY